MTEKYRDECADYWLEKALAPTCQEERDAVNKGPIPFCEVEGIVEEMVYLMFHDDPDRTRKVKRAVDFLHEWQTVGRSKPWYSADFKW